MGNPTTAPAAAPNPSAQSGVETPEEKAAREAREQSQQQFNPNDLLSAFFMMLLKAIFGSFNDKTSEYSEIDQGNAAPSQGSAEARIAIEKPEVQAKLRSLAGRYQNLPADISPFTVNATITSGLGTRSIPVPGASHDHQGIDIVPTSASLAAITIHNTMPGVVVRSETQRDRHGNMAGFGNWVEVACIDGTRRRYGHLRERDVKVGDVLDQGATIGIMGNTGTSGGAHLHYEWRDSSGKTLEPIINNVTYARNDKSYVRSTVLASAAPAAGAPQVAANTPAPANKAPASHAPAHQPTVSEQVAALTLPARMQAQNAYEATTSALSNGMKNARATLGNMLG